MNNRTRSHLMTRIDHVAKANSLLRSVASEPMTSAEATVSMMAAQTHATLALVEQQCIANLIALTNMGGTNQLFDAGIEGLIAPDGLIYPDIAAALRIEVAS